jgi:hypothetical protein
MLNKVIEIGTEILQKSGNPGVSADKGRSEACDGIAGEGIMKNNVQYETLKMSGQPPLRES